REEREEAVDGLADHRGAAEDGEGLLGPVATGERPESRPASPCHHDRVEVFHGPGIIAAQRVGGDPCSTSIAEKRSLMRVFAVLLAPRAGRAPRRAREGEKKSGPACDVAVVEEALWCPKCGKAREKEQLDGEKCKVCQTPVEKLKVCVKKWIAR